MEAVDLVLRLGVAVITGAAIGLNRDLRHKPAGLRTHALVTLGAALITASTIQVAALRDPLDANPVSRAIQGIITGIGFVGAGVILRPEGGRTVRGLTTAASIWIAAALGIACGTGQWVLVAGGTGLTLLVLVAGSPVERATHALFNRFRGRPGTPGKLPLDSRSPGDSRPPGSED